MRPTPALRHARALLVLLALALLAPAPAWAGGDPSDGHSHGEEVGGSSSSVGPGVVTTAAVTARFEVVLKHTPVRGGEPYTGTLYLADYATNAPVAGATVELHALGVAGEAFTVRPTDAPGVYAVSRPGGFPRDGTYDVTVSVQAGEVSDLVLLTGLYVGPVETPETALAPDSTGGAGFPWVWVLVVGLLGLGLAAFLVRSTRRRRSEAAVMPAPVPSAPAAPVPARAPRPEPVEAETF